MNIKINKEKIAVLFIYLFIYLYIYLWVLSW